MLDQETERTGHPWPSCTYAAFLCMFTCDEESFYNFKSLERLNSC